MTYGDISKQFYDKFPNAEVDDWRPADPMFMPQLLKPIPNAILLWLKDGSKLIFISGEGEEEKDTIHKALTAERTLMNIEVVNAGNCMKCGKPIKMAVPIVHGKFPNIFFCRECAPDLDYDLKRPESEEV